MKANPGKAFEEEVLRSIPKNAGALSTWSYKLPDVPMFAGKCRKCRQGWMVRTCARCKAREDFAPTFSPKYPCDLFLSAPVRGTGEMRSAVRPQILFAIDCKRTVGKIAAKSGELHARLTHSQVKDHQVSGLAKVAAAGGVAGILWLVELVDTGAEKVHHYMAKRRGTLDPSQISVIEAACHFIPIGAWQRHIEHATGKSLALAQARSIGVEIDEDAGRGRQRRYWKLAELMIRYGADVEPTPERKAARPKSGPLNLFDQPNAQEEEIEF